MKIKEGVPFFYLKKKGYKLIMKLFLFLFCASLTALSPNIGFSQDALINIEKRETYSLEQLFDLIKTQTDLRFVYSYDQVKEAPPVVLERGSIKVSQILKKCLEPVNCSFEFNNNTIIVRKHTITNLQRISISGTILGDSDLPLPGANIIEKGSKNGAISDFDGTFKMNVASELSTLVISFVGYQTLEIQVGSTRDFKIKMASEGTLEEVVITGYQDVKRDRMTGATSSLKAKDIEARSYSTIDEVLEATMPGVNYFDTGRPGEDANILIRGINSLNGSTAPQWIVDGMPLQGEIPNINVSGNNLQNTLLSTGIGNVSPQDIKSITVLRDAAATAIYGSRAANGVIVIETKSGRVGKTIFNFTSNLTLTERPQSTVRMMNTDQKIDYELDLFEDNTILRGDNPSGRVTELVLQRNLGAITPEEYQAQLAALRNVDTDWFDHVYRTAIRNQYSLSMQGGSEQTQFYASLNYTTEKGTELINEYDNFGGNLSITHNPSEKLRITSRISATARNSKNTASIVNPLAYALYANPYERPYNDDGSYAYDLSFNTRRSQLRPGELQWGQFNILHDLSNNFSDESYLDTQLSLQLEYQITPWLAFDTRGVYNKNSSTTRRIEGEDTYTNYRNNWLTRYLDPAITIGVDPVRELAREDARGSLRESYAGTKGFTFRNTLNINPEFGNGHFINILLGQEISQRNTNRFFNFSPIFNREYGIVGFPTVGDNVPANNIDWNPLGTTAEAVEKFSSFFANGNYSFKDIYVLSGTIRYDGTSFVGNKNQFTPLWNTAFRYNLHNEPFMKNATWLNRLSLRAGYGITASIDRNASVNAILRFNEFATYNGNTVANSFSFGNPNLRWQSKEDRSIGAELRVFNRVEISANYYNNITYDLLDNIDLARSSGLSSLAVNYADVTNKGWELSLNTTNIETENFRWTTGINVEFVKNVINRTRFSSLEDISPTASTAFVEGFPIRAYYGYRLSRIDPDTGFPIILLEDGSEFDITSAENDAFLSAGTFNPPAPSFLGSAFPTTSGGISTGFFYKQFSLRANAEFRLGHLLPAFEYNSLNSVNGDALRNDFLSPRNKHVSLLERWRQPGDVTTIPGADSEFTEIAFSRYFFDQYLEKGDYLRLNLVTLGYELDNATKKKLGLTRAQITVNARNLLTLSKYRGIDPTLLGRFDYPRSRSYSISLNVSF